MFEGETFIIKLKATFLEISFKITLHFRAIIFKSIIDPDDKLIQEKLLSMNGFHVYCTRIFPIVEWSRACH